MYLRTIICLANSRKPPSGRCFAGKLWANGRSGEWIRPVSARDGHEVSEVERRYEDGHMARLLDVVEVPMIEAKPFAFQRENHVLDAEYYWRKVAVASWTDVLAAADRHDAQFWSRSQSTYHGLRDKISETDVAAFVASLKLIHVRDLTIVVQREGGYEGRPAKRKARATFTYNDEPYLLSVSDPEIEDEYLKRGDGKYEVGEAALCISLVEVFHGFSFRVVASVITPQRCEAANA